MSNILVVGDVHFGVRNNSLKYLDFQTNWFRNELIPTIKNQKIKHVFFLGDVFDNRTSLALVTLQRVRELFKELLKLKIQVHCILGNHDITFRNNKSVHSLCVLEDLGANVYDNPTELTINDKNILLLPWIVKDEENEVKKILVNNNYDLCFGHLEINTFEKVKGVVEEEGMAKDLFANCKKVFSGHFHLKRKHEQINYVGTPYELTWNDYMDEKGLCVIDLGDLSETFLPSKDTPKHIKVATSKISIDKLTKKSITNNIIKIIFDSQLSEVDRINYIEKINSLDPLICSVADEESYSLDSDESIEADIKDTLTFLTEYVNLIEIPEELDKKILLEKVEEIYNTVI